MTILAKGVGHGLSKAKNLKIIFWKKEVATGTGQARQNAVRRAAGAPRFRAKPEP